MSTAPHFIKPSWSIPPNIVAYTTTRLGGFSQANYKGLNVGMHVGDNTDTVSKNRALLPNSNTLVWLNQVHGSEIVQLDSTLHSQVPPDADGAFSCSADYHCAVMTADCLPVLLCDTKGTQVAAVHAGWKGLELRILEKAVKHFSIPLSEISVWIGPAICKTCYEVDENLMMKFAHYPSAIAPSRNASKYLLDLPHIAKLQLNEIGVRNVTLSQLCTYCDNDTFFSHRYATHKGLTPTGRIVSVIGLR